MFERLNENTWHFEEPDVRFFLLEGEKEAYKCVNQLVWDLLGKVVDDYVEVWLDDIELIGGDRLSIWEK